MTYSAQYCALISNRLQHPLTEGYSELHHIIPKSEGGSDDADNTVRLTAREHYIAHLLLAKIYNDWKMLSAVTYMQCKTMTQQREFRFNSHLYEKMRDNPILKAKMRENGRKLFKKMNEKLTHEQRSERGKKAAASKTPEQRSEHAKMMNAAQTFEQRSEAAKKRVAHVTFEQRSKASKDRCKGKKWFNNGLRNKRAFECPEGYVSGYLRKNR